MKKTILISLLVILSTTHHKTVSAIYFEDGLTVPNFIEPLLINNAAIEINLERMPDITFKYSGTIQNNTPKNQLLVISNYVEDESKTKCSIGQNEFSCPTQYIRTLLPAIGSEEPKPFPNIATPTPLTNWIKSYYGFFSPENSKDKEFQVTFTLPNALNTSQIGLINWSFNSPLDPRSFNLPVLFLQNNRVELNSFEMKIDPNYKILPESKICFIKYVENRRCFEFTEIRPNVYALKPSQTNFRDKGVLYQFTFDEDAIKLDLEVKKKVSMLIYWLTAIFLPLILFLIYYIFYHLNKLIVFNKTIIKGPWLPQIITALKSTIPPALPFVLPFIIKKYLLKLPTTPLFLPDLLYLFLIIFISLAYLLINLKRSKEN